MSRAFYGCECGVRWGRRRGEEGAGTGTRGHSLLAPPAPQGWPTAATCPPSAPTCRRWCITASSRPPGPRGPRGASPRTCGASIKRMQRCVLWDARLRGGWAGGCNESRPPCSASGCHRPNGRLGETWCRLGGDGPGRMAVEYGGHGGVSDNQACGLHGKETRQGVFSASAWRPSASLQAPFLPWRG